MRRNVSMGWMLVAVTGLALSAAGQATRSRTTVGTTNRVTPARTPYTAEYTITIVQTLANGNTITREDSETRARDSQGREMTATTTTRGPKEQTTFTLVSVVDPVARTITHWSSLDKRAFVHAISAGRVMHDCSTSTFAAHGSARTSNTRPTVENLGTESIQGIEAHGTRTTRTIPAGEVGNEAPIVSTNERWTALAVGLSGLPVREISDDPRSGTRTKELTSIEQSDPDPAIFQPPADYEIVSETDKEASASGCPAEVTPAK